MAITQKTRDADEKLREELRRADIGELRKLIAPLIERRSEKQKTGTRRKRSKRG